MNGIHLINGGVSEEFFHDPLFLAQKSAPAMEADRPIIIDLLDTLRANLDRCVGMAVNMIGEKKRIIVFCSGPIQMMICHPRGTSTTATAAGGITTSFPVTERV